MVMVIYMVFSLAASLPALAAVAYVCGINSLYSALFSAVCAIQSIYSLPNQKSHLTGGQ
jgi:hypothetical protein